MEDSIAHRTYVIKAFFVFKGLIQEFMQDIAFQRFCLLNFAC